MRDDSYLPPQTLQFFFGVDAAEAKPSRPGMNSLVAAGGLLVNAHVVRELERSLDLLLLCREAGFPASDTGRFSWVPEPDQWMSDKLLGDDRTDFFLRILQVLIDSSCKSIGIIRDTEVSVGR